MAGDLSRLRRRRGSTYNTEKGWMKQVTIYVLKYLEDSDDRCTAETELYASDTPARVAMEAAYADTIRRIKFDVSRQSADHSCSFNGQTASIIDGVDYYSWSIEAQRLEGLLAG